MAKRSCQHKLVASSLPVDAFAALERHLGTEDAMVVARGLEEAVNRATEVSWARTRDELLVAMRREFVTRDLFEERMGALRAELLGKTEADKAELLGKMERDKAELLGKIEALYEKTEKDKAELLRRIEKGEAELYGLIRATREELLGKIQSTREELIGKIESTREELLGKIEALRLAMDRKITLWSLALLFAILFVNKEAVELLGRLLGILR
jgi:hypothetical protein